MSDPLQPQTEAPTVPVAETTDGALGVPDLSHLTSLRSYLGVETMDSKTSRQLDYIYQQLKGDKDLNDGDLLTAAKEVKFRVGFPRLGENMVSKIYNYLRASESVKNAEKLRDAYLA